MSPERLTGLDASFLYMETPTLHMHVAMVAVFDPATIPDGYSFRRIRQMIVDRSPWCPSFNAGWWRCPCGWGIPLVDDPEFDIDNHLRRAALPSPGGMRELADFAADVTSRQLHRGPAPVGDVGRRGARRRQDRTRRQDAPLHDRRRVRAELLGVLFDLVPDPAEPAHQGERQLDMRVRPPSSSCRTP